jgi:hypothetical protein
LVSLPVLLAVAITYRSSRRASRGLLAADAAKAPHPYGHAGSRGLTYRIGFIVTLAWSLAAPYTNVEKYLVGLDPAVKTDWRNLRSNVDRLQAR